MRNKTLLSLITEYRFETRKSSNPAHNSSDRNSQASKLRKTQEWLWEKHDWPHLRVRRYIPLQAGQRYFDPLAAAKATDLLVIPADLVIDRLETVEVRYGGEWCELKPGIEMAQFNSWDSDADERSWPVERWQIFEDEQFEIWPIPADDANLTDLEGMLRLTGIRSLRPLVADDDRADLDDKMIVSYAAADVLAANGAKDAQLVLDKARDTETRLTANLSKKPSFRLFGGADEDGRKLRGMPRVHYRET